MLNFNELASTARGYAASGMNTMKTARALDITRGTVRYRLVKISEITRLDPYDFYDLYKIVSAKSLTALAVGIIPKKLGDESVNDGTTQSDNE